MKKHMVSIVIVLTVLMTAWPAVGQDQQGAGRQERLQDVRERWQNMSEQEREKFRAEMRQRRQEWENMSEEDKEKLRTQMRERFESRPAPMGREEQLAAIKEIEEQVARLKASLEAAALPDRSRMRDLSQEERDKLREKMMTAMRDRQMAIRTIDEQLAKFRGPMRPGPEPRAPISELKAIHDLAVKENATETAARLEKLMAGYRREFRSGGQPPEPRPRGDVARPRPERPARPGDAESPGSANRAREFSLKSFDGKTISLSDYKGKTVVLEWLNLDCPFVQYHYNQAHTMIDLAAKYKDKNVVWLAINSTSHTTPEANNEFVQTHKLAYPILDDRFGQVGRAYGAKTTPHIFVIAPGGEIVYEGAIDNAPMGKTAEGEKAVNYVDQALTELLAGKKVSVTTTKSYGCSVKYASSS
jgi:peroxiredoxin